MMKNLIKFNFLTAILMIAMTGCSQNQNKGGDAGKNDSNGSGAFTVHEKVAVKIKTVDETIMYYTHDTKSQKLRMDIPTGIVLVDYSKKEMWMYFNGQWMNFPWNTNSVQEDYFEMNSEEGIVEKGFKKTGTMTVLGKKCDVYSGKNPQTKVEMKQAMWQGIPMWVEDDGKVIYEVLAITFDVPSNFFEQKTIEHSWIK
jgi:hypothetical protein